jgi:hypothetical protein
VDQLLIAKTIPFARSLVIIAFDPQLPVIWTELVPCDIVVTKFVKLPLLWLKSILTWNHFSVLILNPEPGP